LYDFCIYLGLCFFFLPFCRVVGGGFGVPRPPIHLVRVAGGLRARQVDDPARDVTAALIEYAERTAARLDGLISGYVFKCRSPSCGVTGIAVVNAQGDSVGTDAGLFAAVITARLPQLPVVQEDELTNSAQCQNFIERVQAYHRRHIASIQVRGGSAE
jgi:uncharacterized protein YbbK (DUF523 family)